VLSYPAAIPLSTASLTHLSQLLCTHRTQRGVRWRRLGPGRQALRAARKHGIPAALIKFGVAAYADARLPSRGADHRRAVPASPQTAVPHQKMVNRKPRPQPRTRRACRRHSQNLATTDQTPVLQTTGDQAKRGMKSAPYRPSSSHIRMG
jgi:hypothetical protein